MALPVVDTSTTFTEASSGKSTYTFSYDSGTGDDRYLEVSFVYRILASEVVTGMTYNGVSMTLLASLPDGDGGSRLVVFGLIAPATGINDIVISLDGATEDEQTATAITYTGVHQTTSIGTVVSDSNTEASNTDPSITVSTASGELVVDATGQRANQTYTVGADQIEISNIVQGFTHHTTSKQDGADGGVMSWTTGSQQAWAQVGFSIKPVAVAVGNPWYYYANL